MSSCRAAQGLLLLALYGLGCRSEQPAAREAIPKDHAGTPACEGSRTLSLTVKKDDYVHVLAEQGERDIAVTLSVPGGRLLKVDSLAAAGAPWPAEEVHWVANAAGEIRLEVVLGQGPAGPCPLRLATQRPATAADRERALAEASLAQGHELRRSGKASSCRAGVAPYERAQSLFAELELPQRRAESLLALGLLQKDCLGDNKAALRTLSQAEPLFTGSGQEEAESGFRQNLGEVRFKLSDFDGAIDEYRRALELRQRTGSRAEEALTQNTLGHALHLLGRYDEAATHFDRSLDLWKDGDDAKKHAQTHLNRGHLHLDLGEIERARTRFSEALALYRKAEDRDGEAVALNALGKLALDQNRPRAALAPLRQALPLRQPGTQGRAVTLISLGVAYRQLDQLKEAREAYREALPIFRRLGEARAEATSLQNLGWLDANTGHDEAALDHFEQGLALLETLEDPPLKAWTLRGKAQVLRRRGDFEGARKLIEETLAVVERHRSGQQSYDTRAAFFSTQQGHYDFLIDLLMKQHRRAPTAGHDAAALEVTERALARSLLDGLAASGAGLRGRGDPDLIARESAVEATIDELVARQTRLAQNQAATGSAEVGDLLRPVEEELERRWEELERVRAERRAGDPRYAALTRPQPWTAAEIRHGLLDPDTLLLEYRLGAERSYLWAVTPGSLASFELPGRAALEKVARQASGLLARSRESKAAEISARRELARLSGMLLDPVAHLLPGKRLLVVGDGALQNLPFAALPEPAGAPGASEPLVARHEVVTLPSVSVLGQLRREVAGRAPAPKTLWVLADPDFGGSYPPLPYTLQEEEAILELAPEAGRFAVLGREASRQAVLEGALGDYRFLHFATHGSFAADAPGGGRLVLAQLDPQGRRVANGFLHLADIYELDLRADLVVLSACQSALGRDVRGEGMMGMTRGFFYAGAERVLVSLWNVNDRVAAELMQRFYHGMLVEGLSPAAALRAAQDAIRRQPRFRSPYFWAGFVLQGEWR